jgi:RND family efflux transporter MFP subunit
VRIAGALLTDARQTLAEAEARTNQAREDWDRLGNTGEAPDLVLRIPQLESAKARIISAESTLRKAELDLERTHIIAPFAGRVLRKLVDIGQVVSPNTQLAEIYATDVVEIRLPLRNRDLPFIDLPESYRFGNELRATGGQVVIHSDLGGKESWDAVLIRTEGAIDETARQLHVIAQIDDPFGRGNEDHAPLKIGQYVTARLEGKTVPGALVIPNNTIYQGTYVYIVEDEILRRRDIEIAWQNDAEAVIGAGLNPGDLLVTTALGQVTSGIRVSIVGEEGERRMDRNLQEAKK